jgi:hypothetical protein
MPSSPGRDELARLDAGIASGEALVQAQLRRIAELRAAGQDPMEAQEHLTVMGMTLDAWRERRRKLLEELQRAEGRESPKSE